MVPDDRFGFDKETNPNQLASLVGTLVPQRLARWGLAVSVSTDRKRYAKGERVTITIDLRNRLPFPVSIPTPERRLWGWAVDGNLEAIDEPRYTDGTGGSIAFRARERKRFTRHWDGRIKRQGKRARWEQASGEIRIEAFVAVSGNRPADGTTIRIE